MAIRVFKVKQQQQQQVFALTGSIAKHGNGKRNEARKRWVKPEMSRLIGQSFVSLRGKFWRISSLITEKESTISMMDKKEHKILASKEENLIFLAPPLESIKWAKVAHFILLLDRK